MRIFQKYCWTTSAKAENLNSFLKYPLVGSVLICDVLGADSSIKNNADALIFHSNLLICFHTNFSCQNAFCAGKPNIRVILQKKKKTQKELNKSKKIHKYSKVGSISWAMKNLWELDKKFVFFC